MAVRSARASDIPDIHRLLCAIIAEGDYLMSTSPPDLAGFAQFLRANLQLSAPVLVVDLPEGLAGWCDVFPKGPEGQRHVGRMGLGVAAHCRGQGWGRALVQEAIGASWQAGFSRLELEVFTHNHSAIALYRALGFKCEGVHACTRRTPAGFQHTLTMGLLHPELCRRE